MNQGGTMIGRILFPALMLAAGIPCAVAQMVTIQGTVLSVSGAPVSGAVCQFKGIANKATTDASGKYDFTGSSTSIRAEGYGVSMAAQGRQLVLNLDKGENVAVDLFGVSGRMIFNVAAGAMSAGPHSLSLIAPSGAEQLFLVRIRIGSQIAWHKLTLQGGFASITDVSSATLTRPLAKTEAIYDSLFCTSPDFHGGLAHINGRTVTSYSGTANFRMFSSDAAWKKQCSMPIAFNYDNTSGATKYKQIIADPLATEQEVLMEVCQSTFKLATQPKKYADYIANIKAGAGGQVAATGGNTLGFSTEYIDGQPNNYAGWWELVGVQTHEAVHSYQAYYNTTGADGFGEAMPDAVRALNGFFKWPTGTKCTGSFTDVYQTGGKYWYFIEMKHPGFLTSVWQKPTGDISDRVQQITGESLSAMVSECQTMGMP
jgi:hypothetical protein